MTGNFCNQNVRDYDDLKLQTPSFLPGIKVFLTFSSFKFVWVLNLHWSATCTGQLKRRYLNVKTTIFECQNDVICTLKRRYLNVKTTLSEC